MYCPPIPPKNPCNCNDACISTDGVYYAGPNLPGTGIQTNTNLTDALIIMDTEILLLKEALFNLSASITN